MADKNEVHLVGTLKGDPVVRFVAGNKSVCNFRVSAQIGKGSTSMMCVAWDELAGKVCEYRDGERVSVHGYLKNSSWVNKEGTKVWKTEVVVLGVGREKDSSPPNATPLPANTGDEDDLPF